MIDNDFFEKATIEASSVYVEKLGVHFYASAADEEDGVVSFVSPLPFATTTIQGTVTKVGDEEFTLSTVGGPITIEVDELPFNPLDEEGYQRLRPGNRVRVTGKMNFDLFEGNEFVADAVVTLNQPPARGGDPGLTK